MIPGQLTFWARTERILGFAALILVLSSIILLGSFSLFDLDIWLHLKSGEIILKTGQVPTKDLFSAAFPGKAWVDHEWLFQVFAYFIHSRFGNQGLVTMQATVVALIFCALSLIGYRITRSYLIVSLLIFLCGRASMSRFNVRPDMISVFFFVLALYILKFHRNKKTVWILVLLQVLWVNIHGYFFLGPFLVILFLVSEWLRRRIPEHPRGKGELAEMLSGAQRMEPCTDAGYRRLGVVLIAMFASNILNPAGLTGALYPFSVLQHIVTGDIKIFLKYIDELMPTFNGPIPMTAYCVLLAIALSCLLHARKKLAIVDLVLFITFFLFALRLRNIMFFITVSYIIILQHFATRILTAGVQTKLMKKRYAVFTSVISLGFAWWVGLSIKGFLNQADFDFQNWRLESKLWGTNKHAYPTGAVEFLKKNGLRGNVFNDFNSGAYLIGNAYPDIRVFIDGRTEFYGPDFFKDYNAVLDGDWDTFQKLIAKYDPKIAFISLLNKNLPKIIYNLYRSADWKLVYFDETGIIFLKEAPENKTHLEKLKINLAGYSPPPVNLLAIGLRDIYPYPYLKRARLFVAMKEYRLAEKECRSALKISPDCAEAFYLLGTVYLNKKIYEKAFEYLRHSAILKTGNHQYLTSLGVALYRMGKLTQAKKCLQISLSINPTYDAYHFLGMVFRDENNLPEAISLFNQAIKIDPDRGESHLRLGSVYLDLAKAGKAGYLEKAKAELYKARELGLWNKELRAEIQSEIGRLEKADTAN